MPMNIWHDVVFGESLEKLNLIVEIPTGSQNKYELDKEYGLIKLDRVLYSPLHYPGDYGFIPQTLGEDNDPLDGIVMMNFPTYPGTLMSVRPLGMLRMVDQGENDEKILCVPIDDVRFNEVKSLEDVAQPVLDEIAHFFQVYKQLEKKNVEINGWADLEETKQVIQAGIERYKAKFPK
ncbi:MAG TPA: inorganic diphosphatase [Candidatus Andersenbacteria bacterium]|nr:inorganic diphosphatase [Candidatus Andersenbacteria bacterium]